MILYLYLAIRFFQSKKKTTSFDRTLALLARYTLLIVYVSGLVMYITLGMMVSRLHHLISLVPAILMVGVRYIPFITRKENTRTLYAWLFVFMCVLMLVLGVTSRLNTLPRF